MIIYKKLPENLINNFKFESIFKLKPEANNKVIIFDRANGEYKEKTIFRSYNSYLNVPEFDPETKKSYMFVHKSEELPKELESFLSFAQSIDPRYNQMAVNWYNPEDYIELHRDCTNKMISEDSDILMININESDDVYSLRQFIMQDVETKEMASAPLLNNNYYIIKNNKTHRHAVGKGVERRVSITFRMIK